MMERMHSVADSARIAGGATWLVAVLLFGLGCPADGTPDFDLGFELVDVNETSATFDTPVSPRDYLQRVSGWYFGHAT